MDTSKDIRERLTKIITTAYYPDARDIAPVHTKKVVDSIILVLKEEVKENCEQGCNAHGEGFPCCSDRLLEGLEKENV